MGQTNIDKLNKVLNGELSIEEVRSMPSYKPFIIFHPDDVPDDSDRPIIEFGDTSKRQLILIHPNPDLIDKI